MDQQIETGTNREVPIGITKTDQPKSRFARRGIPAYILSGAEKPRMLMQVSRMFFARPISEM